MSTERRAIGVCYLRGVGVTQTKFAQECLIDLIAARHHKDALAYRLEMLQTAPRAVQVIQTVAEMAQWHRPRTGTALGMALRSLFEQSRGADCRSVGRSTHGQDQGPSGLVCG